MRLLLSNVFLTVTASTRRPLIMIRIRMIMMVMIIVVVIVIKVLIC